MLTNLIFLLFAISPFYSPIFGQHPQEWEPANYPNPTTDEDWQRCNIPSRSLLCDPDAILNELERQKLNNELGQLEASTRKENGRNFCDRKGITAAIALARRVRGGNIESVKAMTNQMLSKWNIDTECQKAIMIVMAVEDRVFWAARKPQVPVLGTEMNDMFKAERDNFRAKRYALGIENFLHSIRDKVLSKPQQQPVPAVDVGRSKRANNILKCDSSLGEVFSSNAPAVDCQYSCFNVLTPPVDGPMNNFLDCPIGPGCICPESLVREHNEPGAKCVPDTMCWKEEREK